MLLEQMNYDKLETLTCNKVFMDTIGIECVATHMENGHETVYSIIPFKLIGHDGSDYTFRGQSHIANKGRSKLRFRMYPKHELLPHRQDFCYVVASNLYKLK